MQQIQAAVKLVGARELAKRAGTSHDPVYRILNGKQVRKATRRVLEEESARIIKEAQEELAEVSREQ